MRARFWSGGCLRQNWGSWSFPSASLQHAAELGLEIVVPIGSLHLFLGVEERDLLALQHLRGLGLGNERVAALGHLLVGERTLLGAEPGEQELSGVRVLSVFQQHAVERADRHR